MDKSTIFFEILGVIAPIVIMIIQTAQKNQSSSVFSVNGCLIERHYREYTLLNRFWKIFYFSGSLINITRAFLTKFTNSSQNTKEFLSDTYMFITVITVILIILISIKGKPIKFLLKGMDTFLDFFYFAMGLSVIIFSLIYYGFEKSYPNENISIIFIISIMADGMLIGSCVFLYYKKYYLNTFIKKADRINVILIDGQVIEEIEDIGVNGNYVTLTKKVNNIFEKYIVSNSNIKYINKSFTNKEDSK